MKKNLFLFCFFISCSTTDDVWFVRQIAGYYQVKNSPLRSFVNVKGNIYEDNVMVFEISTVKTRDWAVYQIKDSSKGSGYVPIAYSNAILYIGTQQVTEDQVIIDNMISYAVKIS